MNDVNGEEVWEDDTVKCTDLEGNEFYGVVTIYNFSWCVRFKHDANTTSGKLPHLELLLPHGASWGMHSSIQGP